MLSLAVLDLKGQVGFEALIAVAILLIIFAFAFSVYINRQIEVSWSETFLDSKIECYKVSSLINRANFNGKNFEERATFNTYKIHINGDLRSIEVSWDHSSTNCMFSTVNVTNATHTRFDIFGDYRIYDDGKNVVFQKI